MNSSPALSHHSGTWLPRLVIISAIAFLASATRVPAANEPSALTGQRQSYAYSWEQEVQQGAEADREITQQMGLYDDPKVQTYVESVGRRVLSTSTFANPSTPDMYKNTKFTFRVLDTPVVNAFALPGGYVYVTRGLLAHVDNEAQLAVVLGHEIAHVAARHSSQQARRSQWSQIGVIAGAILGQAVLGDRAPNVAENILKTGSQALQVFMLRYSREAELEADDLGVQYALNSGYAAGDSARFFDALRRLREVEGNGLPTWMSSHPDPGNRAGRVLQLASQQRALHPNGLNRGQEEFLRQVDGLVVGDDPRQGFVRNGVFYHPTLAFQLPVAPDWKVDNQPTALVMAEPNQQAVMGLRLAAANRTRDAAAQFVSENKVQVTASGDTAVNGLPTSVVVGRAATEQGEVGVWNAFIEYQGKVYSLLGYAPARAFEQARPTFESVAGGFGPLREPQWMNVRPVRLHVVRTDRPAPFASLIPTSLPPDLNAEEVAIINQVGLNENVPAGAALKVPEPSAGGASVPVISQQPSAPTYPEGQGYPSHPSQPGTPSWPAPTSEGQNPPINAPSPGYPDQRTYPPQPPTYPGSSTYPDAYPPSQPTPQYPPQPQYPQQPYPQQPTPYPQPQAYPPPANPPPSYPGSAYPPPTYPPATSGQSPNQSYPPPNWPRG